MNELEKFMKENEVLYFRTSMYGNEYEGILRKMPFADENRRKGKWIRAKDRVVPTWICSKCNSELEGLNKTSFCPSCGAKMM